MHNDDYIIPFDYRENIDKYMEYDFLKCQEKTFNALVNDKIFRVKGWKLKYYPEEEIYTIWNEFREYNEPFHLIFSSLQENLPTQKLNTFKDFIDRCIPEAHFFIDLDLLDSWPKLKSYSYVVLFIDIYLKKRDRYFKLEIDNVPKDEIDEFVKILNIKIEYYEEQKAI